MYSGRLENDVNAQEVNLQFLTWSQHVNLTGLFNLNKFLGGEDE